MKSKIIGILMIIALFVALFIALAVKHGVGVTAQAFGLAALLFLYVGGAVALLLKD